MSGKIPDCPPELLPPYARAMRQEVTTQEAEYMAHGPAGVAVDRWRVLALEYRERVRVLEVEKEEWMTRAKVAERLLTEMRETEPARNLR